MSSTSRRARDAARSTIADGELVGGDAGDPVDQLVRLVDDHGVVLGDDAEALQRVDREHGVVGDDDVGLARPLAGQLGEALAAVRALLGAQALARRR